MTTEIRVPTLGESVSEATIGQWFKKKGEFVKTDEPLVELETDKVTIEVPAPFDGILQDIIASEGETVGVDALLASFAKSSDGAAISTSNDQPAIAADTGSNADSPADAPRPELQNTGQPSMEPSPAAARHIAENKLDADTITGSGKRGQVLKQDVMDTINQIAATPAAPSTTPVAGASASPGKDSEREERVRMTRLRQTIARRLKDAQNTAAMLTTFNEVDMGPIMALRKQYKELFEKKHGVKLGFMGFFTRAVCYALRDVPSVNAEIDGTDFVYKNYAHIGIAVGTPRGLVVPVVRDADQMSIAQIEQNIGELGRKARDGKLTLSEMQGGTFTISNGGVYGSLMSMPILNAPQSGILGMHKIQDRVVVVDGEMVIRSMMYLALSYDHRVIDGKDAVTFLVRVKESLEDPQRMILEL